jgi:hypothetical protein
MSTPYRHWRTRVVVLIDDRQSSQAELDRPTAVAGGVPDGLAFQALDAADAGLRGTAPSAGVRARAVESKRRNVDAKIAHRSSGQMKGWSNQIHQQQQ